ncbi:gene transfer agent-like protein [Roseobacter phage RDJL3]|nr:gene transfer agent-like protein [Roseobacter phage RDJL3]
MPKKLSTALQAHLDGRATKMVYCWKVTRNDGLVQGFTDHDNDLTFGGVTYEAATGFTASQFASSMGLAVDNFEVEGALSSSNINEADLAAGHYDNAEVVVYWVNWSDVSERHVRSRGYIGEVKRHGVMFSAEMRGLSNMLQQKVGRKYQRYCNAVIGDARCGINLSDAAYRGTGTVDSVSSNRAFTATGLTGFDDDWFTAGMVNWTSGNNNNSGMEVKLHDFTSGVVTIELWQPMPADIAISDTFTITVGCKQDATTCNEKFNNIVNFRGFNLIPGPDMLLFYPKIGDDNLDGGSLFN